MSIWLNQMNMFLIRRWRQALFFSIIFGIFWFSCLYAVIFVNILEEHEDNKDWKTNNKCTVLTYNPEIGNFDAAEGTRYTDPSSFFYAKFVTKGRPAVIKGAIKDWPALTQWSNEYLSSKIGDVVVTAVAGDKRNHFGATEIENQRPQMKFEDFIANVSNPNQTNWILYLNLQNALYSEGSKSKLDIAATFLRDDFKDPFFMQYHNIYERNFWFGPGGMVSRGHHDSSENVLAMLSGKKKFKLFPLAAKQFLYPFKEPSKSHFIQVDLDNINSTAFPLAHLAGNGTECLAEAGDLLYVPAKWIHQVYSEDRNVAINFWFYNHSFWQKIKSSVKIFFS